MSFFKCITRLLSENLLAVNVLTSPKRSLSLQKITFILLFLHSEPNCVKKSYFQSHLKFKDCLITRCLETTSILVVIETIYGYQLHQIIWKTIGFFAIFFCVFNFYMNFLITRWLETTSILVEIERIYSYQLKLNYLKNYRLLAIFFLYFWYLDEIPDNPLTGNYEYSCSNGENIRLPIQIKFSKQP